MKWTHWVAVVGIVVGQSTAGWAADELYRWTDAQGDLHYSMDLLNLPSGDRSAADASVKPFGLDADAHSTTRVGDSRRPRSTGPAAIGAGPPRRIMPTYDSAQTIAGHDEDWWRSSIQRLTKEVAELGKQVNACTGLKIPLGDDGDTNQKAPDEHFDARLIVVRRCSARQATLEAKKRELEKLGEQARRQDVPPGWLRSR